MKFEIKTNGMKRDNRAFRRQTILNTFVMLWALFTIGYVLTVHHSWAQIIIGCVGSTGLLAIAVIGQVTNIGSHRAFLEEQNK
ncbi:hypothetical protein [Eupransor demetentiae]|uniref:Uncharacterized protein n=1 Tax=Eupransor demetentiae TaxID=3109584 RepID=A0ABM9N5E4_9LACO|nr:hypothetical protein R54876_GBNLAHCA_00966 [Lactobacillaceae bacterium LMG 33000]